MKYRKRLPELDDLIIWSDNVWMGVSIENNDFVYRADDLKQTAARTKFISFEPLLGPIYDINLDGIDWVIVGGESGPGARPMKEEWAINIRDQCMSRNIPFFFKQWGSINKKRSGRTLQGQTWSAMPKVEHLTKGLIRQDMNPVPTLTPPTSPTLRVGNYNSPAIIYPEIEA